MQNYNIYLTHGFDYVLRKTEKYPNLIVRVWGRSGYFNELDIEYQNHVISRTEFNI